MICNNDSFHTSFIKSIKYLWTLFKQQALLYLTALIFLKTKTSCNRSGASYEKFCLYSRHSLRAKAYAWGKQVANILGTPIKENNRVGTKWLFMFSTKVYLKSNQINYHVTPNLSLACLFSPKSPWIEGTKESIHFSQTLADFCSSPWPEGPAQAIYNCPYQCIINVFSDILHNGCSFRSRQQSIQRMILNNTQQSSRVTNPHNLKHNNQSQLKEKNLSF